MATQVRKRSRKKTNTPQPVSTDSTYCILWAGIRGVQIVADGLSIRQTIADAPTAIYPGYVIQLEFDFSIGGDEDGPTQFP